MPTWEEYLISLGLDPEFKEEGPITLLNLFSIELDFNTEVYPAMDGHEGTFHLLECEGIYCNLLMDIGLFVTGAQLNELFKIHPPTIYAVEHSTVHVLRYPQQALKKFNASWQTARLLTTENIGEEDETDIFILLEQ